MKTINKFNIPMYEFRILLAHILNVKISDLFFKEFVLTSQQNLKLKNLISRRKKGEPIAYLVGNTDFYNLCLEVNSSTLIPRPETEEMVDFILKKFKKLKLKVLDIGTGSGAIALSLKKYNPFWEVYGCDIDQNSLKVAIKNGLNLNLNVNFFKSNLFSNVDSSFDLIVSNPPYVSLNELHLLSLDTFFEPQKALFAEKDGFDILEKLVMNSKSFLNEGGFLFLEHGYSQADKVKSFFKEDGWINIHTIKDLQGKNRFTFANI